MENKIQIFKKAEFGSVRTMEMNGDIWFVGKDVADILGYTNTPKAIKDHVDDEDKGVTKCDTLGGTQEITIINESGLYSLVLSSKLPTAKQFKRWVTAEILPSIRKSGCYSAGYQELSPQLQYLISLEKKQNELESKQIELENKISGIEELNEEKVQNILSYGRISYALQKSISRTVKFQCIKICQFACTYEAVGKKVESRIYRDLQKEFNVSSYRDLSYNQISDVLVFVETWQPDLQTTSLIAENYPKSNFNIFSMLSGESDDE